MDKLIKGLEKFNITKDTLSFDDYLDQVTVALDEAGFESDSEFDSEQEWIRLSQNYLKLKYINSILNSEIEYPQKFKFLLNSFLESMDTVTQYYLQAIDWESSSPEINDECVFIQKCFSESLNITDTTKKLQKIIECYDVFIPLIEDFRRERVSNIELEDHEFVESFSNCKRRKLN